MTSLLNGQATKIRFGSISVTSSFASIRLSARAQLAPPKPPPITTMRAADCARDGQGKVNAAADAATPPTTFLRVIRRRASMKRFRYIAAAAIEAAAQRSGEGDVLIAQRHRADAFARRREIGVEHRRSRHADSRLADAAPEAAARHPDRVYLPHLGPPH